MNETKNERFRRVVAPRVGKALKALEQIERCANRLTYEYTDEEVEKLKGALIERLRAIDKAYAPSEAQEPKQRPTFEF